MISKETISSRIKNIVKGSGLTYSEVAKRSGLSQGGLSKWINSGSNINLIDYIKICEACGVPNGVFNEREMDIDIPAEMAEDLNRFNKIIVELHKLCIGKKSPLNIYLEDAESWLPIMREMAKKDPIPYKVEESPDSYVAETNPTYNDPIKADDAFMFSPDTELKELKLIKDTYVSIRKYSRACAGNVGFTDENPEFLPYYVEGHKGETDISLMEISGDSMYPLIEEGDTVVVKQLDDHPRITSEDHVPLSAFKEKIPHGAICILNHDDCGQQVKQIFYSGRDENWGLIINSANPNFENKTLRKGQSLVIYGIVLGKALI